MRNLLLAGTLSFSVILFSCGTSKMVSKVNTQIKQQTPVAKYLYEHNQLNKTPLYIPTGDHSGYLWSTGYESYFESKVMASWQKFLARDLKKICTEEGGKMLRIVSPAEGFVSKDEINDETIKFGDICEGADGKPIFKIEGIIKGIRHKPVGVQSSWQPIVIKIWHKDKVIGARPYSKLISPNLEWEGKEATEVFGPDKLTSLIWKMKGYNAEHKSFVENTAVIHDYGNHPEKWDLVNKFASFCKANNGDLYINGKTLDEFLKYIVETEKLNYGGNPSYADTYGTVFAGKYICNSPKGFTALVKKIKNPGTDVDNLWYKIIVKNQVEAVKKVSTTDPDKIPINENKTYGGEAVDVALKVAQNKTVYVKQQGAITYAGYYNGKENGCDLVSIKKKIGEKTDRIMNYKVCNGQVETLPDTTVPAVPNIVKAKARAFSVACQRYGITQMNVNGITLQCKPLRDYKKCSVEVIYLDNGRILDREIINACNIKVSN
ncbi:hypothetical protein [Persephonella sp.]